MQAQTRVWLDAEPLPAPASGGGMNEQVLLSNGLVEPATEDSFVSRGHTPEPSCDGVLLQRLVGNPAIHQAGDGRVRVAGR